MAYTTSKSGSDQHMIAPRPLGRGHDHLPEMFVSCVVPMTQETNIYSRVPQMKLTLGVLSRETVPDLTEACPSETLVSVELVRLWSLNEVGRFSVDVRETCHASFLGKLQISTQGNQNMRLAVRGRSIREMPGCLTALKFVFSTDLASAQLDRRSSDGTPKPGTDA